MIEGIRRVYVAGPMRGYEEFNFPAFRKAAGRLRGQGFEVISPHEMDEAIGFDASAGSLDGFSIEEAVRRDVDAIISVDAVVVLPGHEKSSGATAERAIADWLGKPTICYETGRVLPKLTEETDPDSKTWMAIAAKQTQLAKKGLEEIYNTARAADDEPEEVPADILLEAYELTTGDRQNTYGPPDQDFRRTAGMWNALFGEFFRDGFEFKPFHVAQAMILLKQSRQLHQRKRDNWADTAGYARCGQLCDEAESAMCGEVRGYE